MANGGRSGRGGSRVLAGFGMEHRGCVAFPLAVRLGATSEPPGCKRAEPPSPPYLCVIAASLQRAEQRVRRVPESPLLGLGGEDRGAGLCPRYAPDLPQSKPPDNMKWRHRFQPVPGSFGGADVPGQRGTPTQQRAPRQGSTSLCQT